MSMMIFFTCVVACLAALVVLCGLLPAWQAKARWERDFQIRISTEVGVKISPRDAHLLLTGPNPIMDCHVTGCGTVRYTRETDQIEYQPEMV